MKHGIRKEINVGVYSIVRDVEDIIDQGYRPEFRQFNRQNNAKVAHLYSIYLSGKSLQYIAEVMYKGRFTRQVLYDLFKVRGYAMRSKKLQPARTYKGVTYRKDKDGHYRSRIGGKPVYLHQLIWSEINGPIPSGYYVIFKDGNKENVVIENLICSHGTEIKKQYYNNKNQFGYQRFENKGAFGV